MVKIVPRGFTTCADSYLTPVIKDYVASFKSGFDAGLEKNVQVCALSAASSMRVVLAWCRRVWCLFVVTTWSRTN
jgi:5-oxoprolinase (ATP-hydrolysing)